MKKTAALLVMFVASLSFAQTSKPTIYLEPQQGFETYLAAAFAKKGVPVDVVTDKTKATYILKSAPVEVKSESTGGKIARCLFAYCAGIEDKGNVSVQLIEVASTKMVWAYSVNKQRGGSKNQQSMAEAAAKHFKEFLSSAPAIAAPAPAPAPAAAPATQPSTDAAAHQTPTEPATQVTAQPVSPDESPAEAALRAKRHMNVIKATGALANVQRPGIALKLTKRGDLPA